MDFFGVKRVQELRFPFQTKAFFCNAQVSHSSLRNRCKNCGHFIIIAAFSFVPSINWKSLELPALQSIDEVTHANALKIWRIPQFSWEHFSLRNCSYQKRVIEIWIIFFCYRKYNITVINLSALVLAVLKASLFLPSKISRAINFQAWVLTEKNPLC